MSEDNIKQQINYSWVSFGSDAGALDPAYAADLGSTHPRAYGNFVRVLGKYVREEKALSMSEAIRKLTGLPATNLKIPSRGFIRTGYFADVVVFDPDLVTDHATFTDSHQLASGVLHVFINGKQVLKDGHHTGATPGRFIKGPGYKSSSH
jgi:N-acyl-D-amino-acid deacylase